MKDTFNDRIIRENECAEITGLSRSTRYRMEQEGTFPHRCHISPGCIGWKLSAVQSWLDRYNN